MSNGYTLQPPARRARGWPFMTQPAPLASHVSDCGVGVPRRQEVEFKDGLRIWLQCVTVDGTPDLYLRDLGAPAEGKRIDLRHFIAGVEKELPTTSTRDVAGYVSISLRLRFARLDEFLDAVAVHGQPHPAHEA